MIRRDAAEHYTWGDGCDGWWLVKSDGLAVIEERMPGGTSERRHFHERSRQFFYVLAGELTMDVDGVRQALRVGDGIEVIPGIAHQAMNISAEDVRFLVVSQPPSHEDRVNVQGHPPPRA